MGLDVLKAEFQKSKLGYSCHDRRIFFCSHWKIPRQIYLAIRVFLSFYSVYALTHHLVYYMAVVDTRLNPLVYFTNWSYILLTIHLALAAVLCIISYKDVNYERSLKAVPVPAISYHQNGRYIQQLESSGSEKANTDSNDEISRHTAYESFYGSPSHEPSPEIMDKWYFKLSWFLSDIVFCTAPAITLVYFTILHKPKDGPIGIQDINVHLLNSVFMLIDFVLCALPIRIMHFWTTLVYGVCWAIFSIIFWSTDHEKHIVYKFANWNKPAMASGYMAGICLGFFFITFVLFCFYRLKIWLYSVIYKESHYTVLHEVPEQIQ